MVAAASTSAAAADVLRLYRRILTLHRSKLAPQMRVLGDQYVRCVSRSMTTVAISLVVLRRVEMLRAASDEFKRHKDAAPKFVPLFVREWEQYAQVMSQKQDRVRLCVCACVHGAQKAGSRGCCGANKGARWMQCDLDGRSSARNCRRTRRHSSTPSSRRSCGRCRRRRRPSARRSRAVPVVAAGRECVRARA